VKVGDLIKERAYPDLGLIVDFKKANDNGFRTLTATYGVLCPLGNVEWFEAEYIENDCEVVSESR